MGSDDHCVWPPEHSLSSYRFLFCHFAFRLSEIRVIGRQLLVIPNNGLLLWAENQKFATKLQDPRHPGRGFRMVLLNFSFVPERLRQSLLRHGRSSTASTRRIKNRII
jgi:hypothetical protein